MRACEIKLEKPDIYVLARFLDVLYRDGKPMKKTNLQSLIGIRYPRFIEYLDWMMVKGLVQKLDEGESELYVLSPKGAEAYHRLVDWIRDMMKGMKI